MLDGSVVQVFTNHWFNQRDRSQVDKSSVGAIAKSRVDGDGKRSDEDARRRASEGMRMDMEGFSTRYAKSGSSKRSIDGISVEVSSKPCKGETGKACDVCL
jgi:hypothetical protein